MTSGEHIHVPTPGELVSPVSGSALVTVARALGTAQLQRGGTASFVADASRNHDTAPLSLHPALLPAKVWLTKQEKAMDLAIGSCLDRWPRHERIWNGIVEAIPSDSTPTVFLHSAPEAAAALRRRRPAARGVIHLHNEVTKGWPKRRRHAVARQTPVVAVSRFVADRFLPGGAARGLVLPLVNGVDIEQFRPGVVEVEPTVLFVGKVTPHKGADLLVEAARTLFEDGLRFRLRIVGGSVLSASDVLSDFEQQLRVRAAPLGSRVSFEPFADRRSIAQAYQDATIFVVPSNWDEPCTLTLGEGMASGLACVASSRGGIPEVGGQAPLYFDPATPATLTDALRRLLVDDEERAERAAAARARAEQLTWAGRLDELQTWLDEWRPA